jgi:hypothetical protein
MVLQLCRDGLLAQYMIAKDAPVTMSPWPHKPTPDVDAMAAVGHDARVGTRGPRGILQAEVGVAVKQEPVERLAVRIVCTAFSNVGDGERSKGTASDIWRGKVMTLVEGEPTWNAGAAGI